MIRELALRLNGYDSTAIDTLYFGGGTPNSIPISQMQRIVDALQERSIIPLAEWTVEMNPESVTPQWLESLAQWGVNRISLGAQSFWDPSLAAVGRRHRQKRFLEVYRLASSFFTQISIDLIMGLPEEPEDYATLASSTIADLKPVHLSVYRLDLAEDTPLYRQISKGILDLPDHSVSRKNEDIFIRFLEEWGYQLYETSNLSLPGYESKHNLHYWNNDDYLGIGVSAGGHLGRLRYVNTSDIDQYNEALRKGMLPPEEYRCENSPVQEAQETLFMGIRKKEGVQLSSLKAHLCDTFSDALWQRLHERLAKDHDFRIEEGRLFLSSEAFRKNMRPIKRLMAYWQESCDSACH